MTTTTGPRNCAAAAPSCSTGPTRDSEPAACVRRPVEPARAEARPARGRPGGGAPSAAACRTDGRLAEVDPQRDRQGRRPRDRRRRRSGRHERRHRAAQDHDAVRRSRAQARRAGNRGWPSRRLCPSSRSRSSWWASRDPRRSTERRRSDRDPHRAGCDLRVGGGSASARRSNSRDQWHDPVIQG